MIYPIYFSCVVTSTRVTLGTKPQKGWTGCGSIALMTWRQQVSELEIEGERIERQAVLDAERTATERNASGQFATPYTLADDITKYTLTLHGQEEVDFLEPACGSGAFFSALLRSIRSERLREAVGIELDPRFAKVAGELWSDHGLKVVEGDFTEIANRSEYRASLLL